MIMIKLSNKFKFSNSQWAITLALLFSVFIFSGFQSSEFQNSREEAQIESQFDAQSDSGFETYLFTGFGSGLYKVCLAIVPGYNIFQLFEFNTRLNNHFIRITNSENPSETNLFFIAKTIPLCSDEDSQNN